MHCSEYQRSKIEEKFKERNKNKKKVIERKNGK